MLTINGLRIRTLVRIGAHLFTVSPHLLLLWKLTWLASLRLRLNPKLVSYIPSSCFQFYQISSGIFFLTVLLSSQLRWIIEHFYVGHDSSSICTGLTPQSCYLLKIKRFICRLWVLRLCFYYIVLYADYFNEKGPATLETINIKDVIKGKSIVMYEDLSNGQEPVPIPCVVDEDVLRPCSCASCRENGGTSSIDIAEPWKCFIYINKRLLDPSLGLDTEVTFPS